MTCLTRNLKLTASAHPMSLPLHFQPGTSRHARQYSPTVIAMPQPELASEYAPMLMKGQGCGIGLDIIGCRKRSFHHLRSSVVCCGGVRGTKGRLWDMPSMVSRLVR